MFTSMLAKQDAMATKQTRLTEAFRKDSERGSTVVPVDDSAKVPPSRRGKRAATVYLDTAAHQQLRMLALEEGASTQALLTEAINDLFQKRGRSRIA